MSETRSSARILFKKNELLGQIKNQKTWEGFTPSTFNRVILTPTTDGLFGEQTLALLNTISKHIKLDQVEEFLLSYIAQPLYRISLSQLRAATDALINQADGAPLPWGRYKNLIREHNTQQNDNQRSSVALSEDNTSRNFSELSGTEDSKTSVDLWTEDAETRTLDRSTNSHCPANMISPATVSTQQNLPIPTDKTNPEFTKGLKRSHQQSFGALQTKPTTSPANPPRVPKKARLDHQTNTLLDKFTDSSIAETYLAFQNDLGQVKQIHQHYTDLLAITTNHQEACEAKKELEEKIKRLNAVMEEYADEPDLKAALQRNITSQVEKEVRLSKEIYALEVQKKSMRERKDVSTEAVAMKCKKAMEFAESQVREFKALTEKVREISEWVEQVQEV